MLGREERAAARKHPPEAGASRVRFSYYVEARLADERPTTTFDPRRTELDAYRVPGTTGKK